MRKNREVIRKILLLFSILTIIIIRYLQYKNMYSNLPLSTINDIAILLLVIAAFLKK